MKNDEYHYFANNDDDYREGDHANLQIATKITDTNQIGALFIIYDSLFNSDFSKFVQKTNGSSDVISVNEWKLWLESFAQDISCFNNSEKHNNVIYIDNMLALCSEFSSP